MKEVFSKIVKVFLIIAALLLAGLLIFGLVLLLDWPWWTGIFLLSGLAGLGIGILFLRKVLARRREQQFVREVIEQDEARLQALSGKERDDLKELQQRWNEAIETLRRSHLRKFGNPLYVLPWYMIIGESGSGKTTAISSARLSSPFAEVKRTSGISGTRNCDWWFFEQAIILDTAGRYAIPVDEGRDKEEWQKFLNLLIKYRKREPLNGLVVTVAADKILKSAPETLEEDGRNIRRRLDELMRALGAKIPVYVLITKCDQIQGMTQFCNRLPEKSLDQAMGCIKEPSSDVADFIETAFRSVGERLRSLRILLVHQTGAKGIDSGLFLFPEEFDHLKPGLAAFMSGAFKENPYQETPVVRGLFFSSGRQEGTPYSHFLNALGLISEREVLPGTSKGLFLHDLFSKILPGERGILAPTQRAMQWRALTRNLGLASWIFLCFAICGLLSFSFVKNLRTLREISHQFTRPPAIQGELLTDLNTMDRFRLAILKSEAQNKNWWIPRFGLTESIKVEGALKKKYCSLFQKDFLNSLDKQTGQVLSRLSLATPDEVIGQYVAHLVRRINLLKGRLEGQKLGDLQKRPNPAYGPIIGAGSPKQQLEVGDKFGNLYLYYLIWRDDAGEVNKEITILQSWLRHVLTVKSSSLRWLPAWVNKEGHLSWVSLGSFWGGTSQGQQELAIAPAFTRKGKEVMDAFLKEIESAISDPLISDNQKIEFERWHRGVCLEAWYLFGSNFSKGIARLQTRRDWQQMAGLMASDQGPYFAFLNRLSVELEPVAQGESIPVWLRQIYYIQMLKAQGAAGGLLTKAAEGGKKIMSTLEKRLGRETEGTAQASLEAAKAFQDYRAALNAITPASASPNQAYQLAAQVFTEDPVVSKSPFLGAQRAATKLRAGISGGAATDQMIGQIIDGPVNFLWTFVRNETALHLQNQWEQTVLAEAQGATGQQAAQVLLGQGGLVWNFVKGPGAPFISWSVQRGYFAREALGGTVPFEPSFFAFLRQGAVGKQAAAGAARAGHGILIRGLPTDANPEARMKPHATRLELQCSTGIQALVNQNFPVSKTFQWAPDTCGDATLQIEVGDLVLTRTYTGEQAFLDFLKDFPGGQHTFYSRDFPRERAGLERMGIRHIRVRYEISGHQAAIKQMGAIPRQAPRIIARCWR